jgi:hypothetical protein
MLFALDKPLAGYASQDGKSVFGGGLLLRSLLESSHSLVRGFKVMPVEVAGEI